MRWPIILFVITVCTTFANGLLMSGGAPSVRSGVLYCGPLLLILLCHEMGHYLTCRHYGIPASLPIFLPSPCFLGTFGAFIAMRAQPPTRKALFDVGVAGPAAGLVVALPVLLVGLQMSDLVPVKEAQAQGYVQLGDSLIMKLMVWLTHGHTEDELLLHPTAFAGWVGLVVTGINLLPLGQLDGGHIAYAALGPRTQRLWVRIAVAALVVVVSRGAYALLIGLVVLLGWRHQPPVDDTEPIGTGRKALACVMLVVFILTFVPRILQVSGS